MGMTYHKSVCTFELSNMGMNMILNLYRTNYTSILIDMLKSLFDLRIKIIFSVSLFHRV
jgi:hypothetical protein